MAGAAIALAAAGPAWATCRAWEQDLLPVPFPAAGGRMAVLTFDGAFLADGADSILSALSDAGIHATFFLAGRFVDSHPDVARRIAAGGHEVGNHTYRHSHLTTYAADRTFRTAPGLSAAGLLDEMDRAAEAYRDATGQEMARLWRAPYGEINREILRWASDGGWTHVEWSPGLDALDWVADRSSPLYRPAGDAARILLSRLRRRDPGGAAVVLLHLGSERPVEDRFAAALPRLIAGARDLGYRFVTAGDAIRAGALGAAGGGSAR